MFRAIIALLTSLPTILALVQELLKWLKTIKEREDRKKAASELKEALKEARSTGDNTKVAEFFNGKTDPSIKKPVL